MIFEHQRFEIWNASQHPYKHTTADFSYTNPSAPGSSSVEGALNWLFAVLYPNTKPAVANTAALPLAGNSINDYRVVQDDGDGKAASYRWEQREGDVSPKWYKVMDMDWSTDSILAQFMDITQGLYVKQLGKTDTDENGNAIVGTFAGQRIWGGVLTNQNLTLDATSADATGYVQTNNHFRPTSDNALDLGTGALKFRIGYFGTSVLVGTMTVAPASITDSSGAISFGDENLSTLGTFAADVTTIDGTLVLASGSITDTTGLIDFNNENLVTTGDITAEDVFATGIVEAGGTLQLASGQITDSTGLISFDNENLLTTGTITGAQVNVDNLRLDGNTLSITQANGDLFLLANGTGVITASSPLSTGNITTTGTVAVTGQLDVDNLRLDGNTISSTNANGDIFLDPNGSGVIGLAATVYPTTSSDLGRTGDLFADLYISGSVKNATNTLLISDLMSLRDVTFRDLARTVPAQSGDGLFFDAVNGVWLASVPDTEIAHSSVSGLTTGDAGHTQFALLAGRAGGQTLRGGASAGEHLTLESTSNASKGNLVTMDTLRPGADATYSGGWQGVDLGLDTYRYRHLYLRGEAFGLRPANYTTGTFPTSSINSKGHLIFNTDNNKLYVDSGTAFIVAGSSKYSQDVVFDGVVVTKDVNVSANITDARTAIIQLLDNSRDFERINCTIKATSASNVRIQTNIPLPAGSYRLVVIE